MTHEKNSRGSIRRAGRTRRRGEAGQALVELSLTVFLIFTPLFIGAAEFARASYCYIEVSNAARSAAQYGSQTVATVKDTAGMLTAAQNDYTLDPTQLSLMQASYVCSCSNTGASASCTDSTACSGAHLERTLTVHVQATFDPGFYEPFMSKTFTVDGWAVQKVLQ